MKKLILLLNILCIFLLLSGCIEDIPSIEDEFARISESIPDSFSEDIILPTSDIFEVEYRINGSKLESDILSYTSTDYSITYQIDVEISSQEETKSFIVKIINNEDPDFGSTLYSEYEKAILYIKKEFPNIMISNTTLPSIDGVEITYYSPCADIERDRLVYSFPREDISCSLSVTITIDHQTKTSIIPFIMRKVDDLPKPQEIYITYDASEIPMDKSYVDASFSMTYSGDSDTYAYFEETIQIRKRGNSTLWMPKASYKLKFDSKVSLLNTYEETDWILLANHSDKTLVRNYLAYSLASRLDMEFTPNMMYVDVYLNNEYVGNYLLTEQIEVSNNRVDIEENIAEINTGYLLEYDIGLYREGIENTTENYFIVLDYLPFVIKSPSNLDEHYLEGQKTYIENYINTVINTLIQGNNYNHLIDEASFVDWFIVSEIFKNVDSGYSSVYYYKDKDGLLKMGPVWDFDLSSGNQGHTNAYDRSPEGFYTSRQDKNILFYYLMQYDSFQQALKTRWNEVVDDEIQYILEETYLVSDSITYSRYKNFIYWDWVFDEETWYTAEELLPLKTYDEQLYFLYDYFEARIAWLDENINNF